jgi:hypothetical protein
MAWPRGARRLEVQHRLHRERLEAAEERRQRSRDSRLEQPVERDVVPAMHVDHAGVALQRIVRPRIDADHVAGIRAGLAGTSEVIARDPGRLGVEDSLRDDVALLLELPLRACVYPAHPVGAGFV